MDNSASASLKDEVVSPSNSVGTSSTSRNSSEHTTSERVSNRLASTEPGKSQVELLANYIETRRDDRVPITLQVRKRFLKMCRNMAVEKGYDNVNSLHFDDIMELVDKVEQQAESRSTVVKAISSVRKFFGSKSSDHYMIDVLQKAIHVIKNVQDKNDNQFCFLDFNLYYTKLEYGSIWLRYPFLNKVCMLLAYYIMTPVVFCVIAYDEGICPTDPTDRNRSYYGWISSLYFASTTLSTVGYGDLSVSKTEDWRVFLGVLYMIIASIVMALCFASVVNDAFNVSVINMALRPIHGLTQRMYNFIRGVDKPDDFIYDRIRRMRRALYAQIFFQFTVYQLIGFFVSRFFVTDRWGVEGITWTWMESLYWVVQTSTTIGYGDMQMPFGMRLFQIFYLTLGAFYVANAIGRLGSIEAELDDARSFYAWKQQQLSKSMIRDLKPLWNGKDECVDQYEYVVSSLLNLGKVSSDDVKLIMDKFRELCAVSGDPGFLKVKDIIEEQQNFENEDKLNWLFRDSIPDISDNDVDIPGISDVKVDTSPVYDA